MADRFVEQAVALLCDKRYLDAVRTCRRGLLTRPGHVGGRLVLATALLALRRHDEVRIEMLDLLVREPALGIARRLLGEAYLRSGDRNRARVEIARALERSPADPVGLDLLAEVSREPEDGPTSRPAMDEWWLRAGELTALQDDSEGTEEEGTDPDVALPFLSAPTTVMARPRVEPPRAETGPAGSAATRERAEDQTDPSRLAPDGMVPPLPVPLTSARKPAPAAEPRPDRIVESAGGESTTTSPFRALSARKARAPLVASWASWALWVGAVAAIAVVALVLVQQARRRQRVSREARAGLDEAAEWPALRQAIDALRRLGAEARPGQGSAPQARLLALAALEYEAPTDSRARALLARSSLTRSVDSVAAEVYVALSHGDVGAATSALASAEASLGRRAGDPELSYARGRVQLAMADAEAALGAMRSAHEARPANHRYAIGLVRALVAAGRHAEAIEQIESIQPPVAAAHLWAARVRIEAPPPMRDSRGARTILEALSQPSMAVRLGRTERAWTQLLLADLAVDAHRYAEAEGLLARVAADAPQRDFDFLDRHARLLLAVARPEEARRVAERALALGSGRPEVQALVAETPLGCDDLAAADAALALGGSSPRASLLRGIARLERGDWVGAHSILANAERAASTHKEARIALGWLELRRGATAQGLQAFQVLDAQYAEDGRVVLGLAHAFAQDGRLAQASAALTRAAALLPQAADVLALRATLARLENDGAAAIEAAQSALLVDPASPEAHAEMGRVRLARGEYSAARTEIETALRRRPADWRVMLSAVRLSVAERVFDEATDRLVQAERAGAPAGSVAAERGRLWLAIGRTGEAATALAQAVQTLPRDVDLRVALGDALYANRSLAEAAGAYDAALAIDAGHPEALFGRASADLERGDAASARRTLSEAERALATHVRPPRLRARVGALRARILAASGDAIGADAASATAVAEDPQLVDGHLVRARVLMMRGRDARDPAERAVGLAPDSIEAFCLLAQARARAGERGPACQAARSAQALRGPAALAQRARRAVDLYCR